MTMTDQRHSRRSILKGAAAGAGAMAIAGCGTDYYDGPGVIAVEVDDVPADDPGSTTWNRALPSRIALGPQDMVLPMKLTPMVTELRVSTIYDADTIGFLLEWDDPNADDTTVRVDDFRDACAVMLLPGAPDEGLRTMGSATTAATLLQWKADWQRDVDDGRQGLDAVYPNRSVDVYPIVHHVPPADVDISSYEDAGATQWLPGVDVGNPTSAPRRSSPVEKAIANGFSTTTTAATQNATGRGQRTDRGWRVVITKPLAATDDGELACRAGITCSCAFAVWSGSDSDAGSRKQPSTTVHTLDLKA
jgi:hypothetical protein